MMDHGLKLILMHVKGLGRKQGLVFRHEIQ